MRTKVCIAIPRIQWRRDAHSTPPTPSSSLNCIHCPRRAVKGSASIPDCMENGRVGPSRVVPEAGGYRLGTHLARMDAYQLQGACPGNEWHALGGGSLVLVAFGTEDEVQSVLRPASALINSKTCNLDAQRPTYRSQLG